MSLPGGVQEVVDERDWERARSQLALLTERFQPMSKILRQAAASLRRSPPSSYHEVEERMLLGRARAAHERQTHR